MPDAEFWDRQLLASNVPPSHVRAGQQLCGAKIAFLKVVAANPEAILYVDEEERAMTAWTETQANGSVSFHRQMGFPAWPSPYLKDTG